jgi:hypothetical protein
MPIRRKTRETLRHERAVVLQEKGTPTADQVRADIEANKAKAADMRKKAQRVAGTAMLLVLTLTGAANGCEDQSSPARIPDGSTKITKNMRGIWNAPGGSQCRWWLQTERGVITHAGNVKLKGNARTQSQSVVIGTGNVGQLFKSDRCKGWRK